MRRAEPVISEPIYSGNELKILTQGLDPDLLPNVDWMDTLLKMEL